MEEAKKTTLSEDVLETAVGFVMGELESIGEQCDEEINGIREYIRGENEAAIKSLAPELNALDMDRVINHPEVRAWLMEHIKSLIDHLTYQNGD